MQGKNVLLNGGEAVEEFARRSCECPGCPIPGGAQGQVGWNFEQSGFVENMSANGRDVGTK